MENTGNTNQNPEQENIVPQEENSNPVVLTTELNQTQPPTEPAQTDDISPREIIQEQTVLRDEPIENQVKVVSEEPIEEQSEEHIEDHLEDHPEEITDESALHLVHDSEEEFDHFSRAELIDHLEKAVAQTDINAVKSRIALIKVAFLKKKKEENLRLYEKVTEEGSTKEEQKEVVEDELDSKFNEIFNIYKANKARYTEEQEKIKLENLKKKFHILEELKLLINSEETLKKTYDEFKTLQDRWKEVGMVPRTELNNLWQNYHFLVEKFFEKVKLNKEMKDLDLRKNMESKIAICEKTEELLLETSAIKSFKKLQKYHEEWKEIGPVPADKKDEIWERFKNTTDKINDRRREHYTLIEQDQQKNLETKTALCEQAEETLELRNDSIKEWQENTNKVNELLNIWKSVGPVPQKVNAEIWTRFKSALDGFFANKKEFFDKLKEQQLHNYNLKVELCLQAESLQLNNDWKKTTNELIRLQGEWKKIGPVPKKNSDKIWKRFRAACDAFFQAKSAFFTNIQGHEEENLQKKTDLMNRLKEYQFGEDKSANLEVLKNFQREWTEIGHVPIKEKDRLQNEFRSLISGQLDKLKISEVEMSTLNFQARFESMKNDPQAKRFISREKEVLMGKIGKMKEDINLWENNIGFLAKSKNAMILKEEFEKKIEKAKSELKVMEAKFKILKQQIS